MPVEVFVGVTSIKNIMWVSEQSQVPIILVYVHTLEFHFVLIRFKCLNALSKGGGKIRLRYFT